MLLPVRAQPAAPACVCTSLRMAARLVTSHYDRALASAEITANDYSILSRLDRDGPLPLGMLAARLAMNRSTISRELAPLVRAGLVEAAGDELDRRKRVLSLTSAGTIRLLAALPLWAQAQADLATGFGVARTDELVHELHALLGAVA
jgi:DNA-binding MarR family transcriptional regulator